MDPFRQSNTYLFRFGPTCFRTNEEKYVFLEVTKSHETYNQLPDEIFRVQRKKRKKLVEASVDDNFSNNEEEKMQCARCHGEEDICGAMMLIQTRARKLKERKDDSTEGETTDHSSIAPDRKDQRDLTMAESIPIRSPESKHEKETFPDPLTQSPNHLLKVKEEQ